VDTITTSPLKKIKYVDLIMQVGVV